MGFVFAEDECLFEWRNNHFTALLFIFHQTEEYRYAPEVKYYGLCTIDCFPVVVCYFPFIWRRNQVSG